MNEEKKNYSLLENYAKLAIHIYTYFNDDIYKTAKENKYPYSECLYQHYYNNENKSNAAKLFLNVIYLDESSKQTIEEIANELNNNSKKTKR